MEVVTASPGGAGNVPPYQRRDVAEWSQLDHLTGMLEHGRVETDHWAANTHNTAHKYGKVVDSRDRCTPDGRQHQRQRRQLEVFQAHVPGGSLQVVRTQTVATSGSRWTSRTTTGQHHQEQEQTTTYKNGRDSQSNDFENLQLALNPLDLSSQKTKASVGRSGSIGGRRPPSRPRSIVGRTDDDVTARLQRVSQLCQQLHDKSLTTPPSTQRPSLFDKRDGSSIISDHFETESIPPSNNSDESELRIGNGIHSKSPSPPTTVDFHKSVCEKNSGNLLEQIEDWRRSNINRRSLQFSKQNVLSNKPSNIPDRKLKTDLDTDRRLNTALRGNNVDLEALDQILKSISSSTSSTYSDKKSLSDDLKTTEEPERDNSDRLKGSISKRHSFITVESLQEVRGRLRRLSSPTDDLYIPVDQQPKEEEPDDGIVAEDSLAMKKEETAMPASNAGVSRVKSYVYGMEAMMQNKKPISGTGSLESRTSNKSNGSSSNRSEDWYNRRKSYGFEQVHNQQIDQSNSISRRGKNKIESSTDSGICRSTEIVVVPQVLKSSQHYSTQLTKSSDKSDLSDEATKYNAHKVTTTYNKIGNSTVISLGGDVTNAHNGVNGVSVHNDNSRVYPKQENELFTVWNRRAMVNSSQETQLDNNKLIKNDAEHIKITIPIVAEESVTNTNGRRIYHRQMSDGTSVSVESSPWSNGKQSNGNHDIKRHSIAVDESKYVTDKYHQISPYRRTSLAIADNDVSLALMMDADDDEFANSGKKHKKVEFSKTEVHFAAESGRVNIVETDEKPPPTQNFRRRRRNSSSITNNHVPEDLNKNGLPLIHFGDTSYEKKLFGVSDQENGIQVQVDAADTFNRDINPYLNGASQENVICNNTVTVSSVTVGQDYEPELKENHENESQPRGILKNKMIKPRPYLLGDDQNEILSRDTSNDEQEGSIWGVRLKPVSKTEEASPIWRSTVTVQNTSYNVPNNTTTDNEHETVNNYDTRHYGSEESKPEFHMLLNSLRPARNSEPTLVPPECVLEEERARCPMLDPRRSSWSVADRVKQVEDLRCTENKGYSTKVHFGSGEATVVENVDVPKHAERHTTWPRQEETHNRDEKKQSAVLNKGLVVRIGREDSSHTVCSKTTTSHNSNSTTTTTKITIDMSPSPTNVDKYPVFSSIKLPRASLHSLKSTSLIMNTFAKIQQKECTTRNAVDNNKPTATAYNGFVQNGALPAAIPDQLAALRRLYEEAAEHSDDSEKADEEVRSYMSGGGDDDSDAVRETEDDVSSVVSGSWSKMRAFRNIKQHLHNLHTADSSRQKESEMFRNIINRHTYTKKDFSAVKPATHQPNIQKKTQEPVVNSRYEKHSATESKVTSVSQRNSTFDRKPSDASLTDSPRTDRRPLNGAKKTYEPVRTQYTNGHLSSPSLVGSSIQKPPRSYQSRRTETVVNHSSKMDEKKFATDKDERTSAFSKISASHIKDSPSLARKNLVRKTPLSYTNNHSAYTRRNDLSAKKTEAAPSNYYNEIQSPKPTKKLSDKSKVQKQWKENKPDLLQHFSDTREYVNLSTVIREDGKNTVTSASNKSKSADIKKVSSTKKTSRIDSPSVERAESPIYENIDEVITSLAGMEKESAILQELTKAADQILQAVNGYTDEDSIKHSTDEEDDGKKHRLKNFRKTGEVLSTISETKSWKQVQTTKQKQIDTARNIKNVKSRVRPTSSTSSIESIARESKPVPPVRQNRASKLQEDKTKKKISASNSELSKATRARRLQRANSREALLQSHGSSSEDISNSLEVARKPRLVRRTKAQSGSDEISSVNRRTHVVSQTNVSRRRECDVRRSVDRVPVVGLQEIRHKTAISTIKSTAEKNASREKAMKSKSDDLRKRTSAKRDTSISKGSNMVMMSAHHSLVTACPPAAARGTGGSGGDGDGGSVGRDPMAGVTAMAVVRTSSGVAMRRSNRSEGITKH